MNQTATVLLKKMDIPLEAFCLGFPHSKPEQASLWAECNRKPQRRIANLLPNFTWPKRGNVYHGKERLFSNLSG